MPKPLSASAIAFLLTIASNAAAAPPEIVRVHDVPRDRIESVVEHGDFWGVGRSQGQRYLVMAVEPDERAAIEALGFRVTIDEKRTRSVEYFRAIDRDAWRSADRAGIPGYPCYRTVDETVADLSAMATARPELARWETIGQSWRQANGSPGGDDIHALVLSNANSPHPKAPLVVMAAQHARELTTAEAATRFAEWLFDHYDTDPTARWLLDHREIHIIAQQNPDGRREVEDGDIWWRKNANETACPSGTPGVDLNRNSPYFWGDYSSGNACSEVFRGDSVNSEPETQAIESYLRQVFEEQWSSPGQPVADDAEGLFISLHSFGRLILMPWEGSGQGPSGNAPNHDQLAWLGRKFGFFTGYEVGRDILYPAGGTTTDFAHGEFGVAAYTFEIGTDFHQACSYFEQTLWPRVLDSLVYAARAAHRPYSAPSGPDIVEPSATFDPAGGIFRISGRADDTRFDRGGVGESPADDPIAEPAWVLASLSGPPVAVAEPLRVELVAEGPSIDFEFDFELPPDTDLPALLYLQALDSQNDIGVPEAVWLDPQPVFGDAFETRP
jgi:hypothetical protein